MLYAVESTTWWAQAQQEHQSRVAEFKDMKMAVLVSSLSGESQEHELEACELVGKHISPLCLVC